MVKSGNLANILRNSINAALLSAITLAPIGCGRTIDSRLPLESDIASTKYFDTKEKRELIRDIYRNPEKYADNEFKKEYEKKINDFLEKYKTCRLSEEEQRDFERLRKDCPCVNLKNPGKADKVMLYLFVKEDLKHLFD